MSGAGVFSPEERAVLLAVKGVGPTVVSRFEELGIASLAALSAQDVEELCGRIAVLLGATCWRNSPRARGAVVGAIEAARGHQPAA